MEGREVEWEEQRDSRREGEVGLTMCITLGFELNEEEGKGERGRKRKKLSNDLLS